MSNGFARRKEQSKEEIRRAAWELFSQFGVERVSIVDIARKAGVSQATIYNNFDNKEALAREFVTSVVDRLVARAGDALAVELPYREKMASFVQFIATIMTHDRPAEENMTLFTSSADLQRDPEIRKIRGAAWLKKYCLTQRMPQSSVCPSPSRSWTIPSMVSLPSASSTQETGISSSPARCWAVTG